MGRHEVAEGVPRQRLGHVGRRGREDVVANFTRRQLVRDRVPHAPRQRDLRRGTRCDEARVYFAGAVADRVRVRPARVLVIVDRDQSTRT